MNGEDPTNLIHAPWDDRTVRNLNRFQQLPWVHPYTCGYVGHASAVRLCATSVGWKCADPHDEGCEYTQNWASASMATPSTWPQGPRYDSQPSRAGLTVEETFAAVLRDARTLMENLTTSLNANGLINWLRDAENASNSAVKDAALDDLWCCNGNAEECELCDVDKLPYPWICPGDHERTPRNRRAVLVGSTDRGRDALKATMRRLRVHDQASRVEVAESHVCETNHVTSEDEAACETARVTHRRARRLVSHPGDFVDDPNAVDVVDAALEVVDAADAADEAMAATEAVSAIQAWADEDDLATALGGFGDGYRSAQRDAQIALGLDRIAAREGSKQAPDDLDPAALRAHASQRLLAVGVERIEREWICCDPIDPSHSLCVQGAATRKMFTALMTDDETVFPATSDVLNEVMRLIQGIGEPRNRGSVLSRAELQELYGKALRNGYREINAGVGAETLHVLTNAVVSARDRELARNRHRLTVADVAHRRIADEQIEHSQSLQAARERARLEERVRTLDEVAGVLQRANQTPYDTVALATPMAALLKLRKNSQRVLDERSDG